MRITPGIFSPRRVDALKRRLRVLANLYVERTKLTLADRLAMLMGAIVLVFVCLLLGTIGLVFIWGALIELFSRRHLSGVADTYCAAASLADFQSRG